MRFAGIALPGREAARLSILSGQGLLVGRAQQAEHTGLGNWQLLS